MAPGRDGAVCVAEFVRIPAVTPCHGPTSHKVGVNSTVGRCVLRTKRRDHGHKNRRSDQARRSSQRCHQGRPMQSAIVTRRLLRISKRQIRRTVWAMA